MKEFVKDERQGNMNSRKEYTIKIKVDTYELDDAIKKLKKLNKLAKKKIATCNI